MPNEGYITLSYKILKWGWYSDANTARVFIHLLLNANWHDGEYHGCPILRGQCVFGRKRFSEDLKLSERSVRTAISHLKTTNEISIKATNKFTVITIVKYNDYQILKNENDQQNDQPAVKPTTTSQTVRLSTIVSSKEDTCPNLNSDVPKSKPVFEPESKPYRLAAKLFEMILINNPDSKKKTETQLQSWAYTFDLMVRIDKRNPRQIYDVMFYSQNSEFWRSNILSASKLREQYDKLKMQMEDGRK